MKSTNMKHPIFLLFLLLSAHLVVGQKEEKVDSLDIKIGQMVMVGYSGTSLRYADPIVDDIKNGMVGGVILFEKNISDSNSVVRLKQLIYAMQSIAPVPLVMAIDQEGGSVNRLKTKYGFPKSVTAAYLGEQNNNDTTKFLDN